MTGEKRKEELVTSGVITLMHLPVYNIFCTH